MTILEAILLGIVQGLTEFLPVSSSGHLALMGHFLGLREPQVFFDVMLHLGTLGAVVIAYKQPIRRLVEAGLSAVVNPRFYRRPIAFINGSADLKLIWFILIGSAPTGAIAIAFKATTRGALCQADGRRGDADSYRRYPASAAAAATRDSRRLSRAFLAFAAYRNSSGVSRHARHFTLRRHHLNRASLGDRSETGGAIFIPSLHSRNYRRCIA